MAIKNRLFTDGQKNSAACKETDQFPRYHSSCLKLPVDVFPVWTELNGTAVFYFLSISFYSVSVTNSFSIGWLIDLTGSARDDSQSGLLYIYRQLFFAGSSRQNEPDQSGQCRPGYVQGCMVRASGLLRRSDNRAFCNGNSRKKLLCIRFCKLSCFGQPEVICIVRFFSSKGSSLEVFGSLASYGCFLFPERPA